MHRVLFIAYLYPPIANSGTRRSIEFANHLPENNWLPTVLTVADPDPSPDRYDETLLNDVRSGIRVERAPMGSDVWSRRIAAIAPDAWRERIQAGLAWRLRALWTVPDAAALWRGQAVCKALALHREQQFDLIYASGSPWTSFLVAHDVSQATGLPYVIDYRDPWTPSGEAAWETETRLQRLLRKRLERRVAGRATEVVTVTQRWVETIGRHIGRSDLHCITNGFEPQDFSEMPFAPDDGLVRISYTGVWRRGYGPHLLYEAIRLAKARALPGLDRLRVDTAGFPPGRAKADGTNDLIVEHGRVSHSTALELLGRSDLVFLPVSEGAYAKSSVPGKLYEYMGTGRPILAAVPADSEVARILGDTGGALRVDPDDVEGVTQVIARLCAGNGVQGLSARRPDRLERYTRAATTQQLAAVFSQVLAARRKQAG